MSHDLYVSPLSGRYPSKQMQQIWSNHKKFQTWRRIWIELARAQQKLGLKITDEQIEEMEANVANINYELAEQIEKKKRHDVVAHIDAFGAVAPKAKPIIHLGATSCDITDNAELIQIKESLGLVCRRVAGVISRLRNFAMAHRNLPTLGYTHFQPAQPTTVGKRAAMWLQDLVMDLEALEAVRDNLRFRGIKGATGTQDSFLKLFDGDRAKVQELDRLVTQACGFSKSYLITGQTYTRKQDSRLIMGLADFATTVHKICTDLRLLQSMKELDEPFEPTQVGSSAMAHKRNPMRSERGCALSREAFALILSPLMTHAVQWFERSLDDSAARRRYVPESFLLADAIALILQNIFQGVVVYPAMITRHLQEELPFMAMEEILMAMVKSGADRQECHERNRQHAQAASLRIKQDGVDNDLLERFCLDPYYSPVHDRLSELTDPTRFIGCAPQQVEDFLPYVDEVLAPYADQLAEQSELSV